MANNDASNIIIGSPRAVGGYAFRAPLGSTGPTDATTALDAAFECLGFISDKGVKLKTSSKTEDLTDWNLDVVKTLTTEKTCEVTVSFMETNPVVAKAVYGTGNVTASASSIKIAWDGEPLPHEMFAFELSSERKPGRIWFNDAQIIDIAEQEVVKNAAWVHEVTIKCFKDAAGKFFHREQSLTAA